MTDELGRIDAQLRDRARTTPLPEAPESLRAFPAGVVGPPSVTVDRPRRRSRALLALIPAAILVVTGLAIAGGTSILRAPAVVPSASTRSSAAAVPVPQGFRHISTGGIELNVPEEWVDATAWVPSSPGKRIRVYLIDGIADCPGSAPTAGPGDDAITAPCLSRAGSMRESLSFVVIENLDPLPGEVPTSTNAAMTIGGYPAAFRPLHGSDGMAGTTWDVAGPGSRSFSLMVAYPGGDAIYRQPQIASVIDGVRFDESPPIVPQSSTAAAPAGFRHIDVDGLGLDVPVGWTETTGVAPAKYPYRHVISFEDGQEACGSPSPDNDCFTQIGTKAGTLGFGIYEWLNPTPIPMIYPLTGGNGQGPRETPTAETIGGYPAQRLGNGAGAGWWVFGPHGHLYTIGIGFPGDEAATRQPEIDAVLGSIRFTDWTPPPPPLVDGWYHFDAGVGVQFDYPTDWKLYYPNPYDGGGWLLVSRPLSVEDMLGQDKQLPGTMSVGFGYVPDKTPDWSTADTTIDGLPAIRTAYDANSADVKSTREWMIRLGDPQTLVIKVEIQQPGRGEFDAELDRLIGSLRIEPAKPLPTP